MFHAVAYKRHEFADFLAAHRVNLSPIDAHDWTPLDLASSLADARMVALLARLGAKRKSSEQPASPESKGWNSFNSSGYYGGPDLPVEVERIHVQLNGVFHNWRGNYTRAVEGFSFPKFVDGSLIRHTETMKVVGAQKAKRKRNSVEAQIVVPENWWREPEPFYKRRLTDAIEQGLHSMIALLERNRYEVGSELLLADWEKVKKKFLETPAPPFAAEHQRANMLSLVQHAMDRLEAEKLSVAASKLSTARKTNCRKK